MKLILAHLYPRLMNLYGDAGNITVLVKRCRWRKIETKVLKITPRDEYDLRKCDLIFIGGGQDREQKLIHRDLIVKKEKILAAVEEGIPLLAICGGFQLLGNYYASPHGNLPGVELFDIHTEAGEKRMIGNIVTKVEAADPNGKYRQLLAGFENHAGETFLGSSASPLGKVVSGYGNNREGIDEGCRYRNAFGTYLHGPVLPRNPHLADYLLQLALERKYGRVELKPLDDIFEKIAHQRAVEIARKKNSGRF